MKLQIIFNIFVIKDHLLQNTCTDFFRILEISFIMGVIIIYYASAAL